MDRATAQGDPSALHFQELAQFLCAHLYTSPGVLWPEHDHPVQGAPAVPERLAQFAEGLQRFTGLPARSAQFDPAVHRELAGGHLLVHQTAGTAQWHVTGPGAEAVAQWHWRLRAGEVLYVPAHWTWRADPSPGSGAVATWLAWP